MKAKDPGPGPGPRFDVSALRKLAGEKVFGRGEDYHADGQVEILSLEPDRVLAEVVGSEDYRTMLTGRGGKIGGECSCPAFEDWGFCKHMVATALAANEAGDDAAIEGEGALGRIRAHLKAKGIDALVDMVIDLAERDPALFRKLDMAAAVLDADKKVPEARLRRAIDAATRTGRYVDYDEADEWAGRVEDVLDTVAEFAGGKQATLASKLAEHAIDRIEGAIESIDDSDGDCSALLERARDIHLAACRAMRPDPVTLARELFARETKGQYDTFSRAAAVYADVLGDDGLAEYRRLAAEAWKELPRHGKGEDLAGSHWRLERILDFFAEREGNLEGRIALRAKDLSSSWRYLDLARFCLENGRKDEALRYAEEGLWIFEDQRPNQELILLAVGLLTKAGRKADGEAHLWRAFEKMPSLDLYNRLRRLGGKAARERALALLQARLTAGERGPWHGLSNLLIRLLIEEKMFDAAWSALEKHGGTPELQQELADASRASHPEKALAVYAALVEQHVRGAQYEEACQLVGCMATLRDAAQQAAYLAELKERHRRKRNLIKLL